MCRIGNLELGDATLASIVAELEGGNGSLTLERARVSAILGDGAKSLELLRQALSQPMGPSEFEVSADPHFAQLDLSTLSVKG